jgi:hypothetical protein
MVGFHLRHRDNQVAAQDGFREPEAAKAGVRCKQLGLDQVVSVQIHEFDVPGVEFLRETGLGQNQIGVALVAWPLGNDDAFGPKAEKAVRCRADEFRIRVHFGAGNELDQVWLEHYSLAHNEVAEWSKTFDEALF